MDNNLITIAEYAKIRGCSTAAVYKRLDTTLKPYKKTVNKKTYLSRQLLVDEGLITVDNQSGKNPVEIQPVEQTVDNGLKLTKEAESPALLEVVKALERQIEAREKEIDRLHQENNDLKIQLNEAAKHNQENTEKLMELLAQAQELNRNNQLLLAQARQPLQLEETEEKKEAPKPEQKKSFWRRLWDGEI